MYDGKPKHIDGTDANASDAGYMIVGALLPVVSGGTLKKIFKGGDKAVDAVKKADKASDAKQLLKEGRSGKQARLTEIGKDPKVSKSDKGWIKSEQRQVATGNRKTIRNPPGKDLAHSRGKEAAKGYSYKNSKLQDRDLHRRQHKYDNNGKKNKENPN
ncbi:polymorphic toxin type 8 domain-containing protein [Flavobacterium sp. XS2P12]